MPDRIIRGGKGWRPYRFPPRTRLPADGLGAATSDPEALQRAIHNGFHEGSEKGFAQGLEQGRQQGFNEGFNEGMSSGKAEGHQAGKAEGRAGFDQAAASVEKLANELRNALTQEQHERHQDLMELVRKTARQVIRCELTLNPAQLLNLAEEALATLPRKQQEVRILLNPEEHERIAQMAPERAQHWQLVADERLAPGECRVVTEQTEIDVGCQQRLDACLDNLTEHLAPGAEMGHG